MKTIARNACVLTGREDLEPLHSFPAFPVFMGTTTAPPEQDIKADMNWTISAGTGIIQLNPLLPLDVLYPESHGAGSVGKLWDEHHKSFAAFVRGAAPKAVFEIGGAHGLLATHYRELDAIDWTIIEPNPTPVPNCPARFIKGFFDADFTFDQPFDAVVHSHLLEHVYDPDAFMRQLASFMEPGKHLIFSVPNMQVMLERHYTNCINFEHTLFLSTPYILYLLAKHGFRLICQHAFKDDHSLFFDAVRDPAAPPLTLTPDLYEKNKALYQNYTQAHLALIARLNEAMAKATAPVYLFGAHVFAQYLIAFGLDTSRITALLDNDPNKQGKRLYGTTLTVQAPKVLKPITAPLVILKAGVYNAEVRADILENINPTTLFLE